MTILPNDPNDVAQDTFEGEKIARVRLRDGQEAICLWSDYLRIHNSSPTPRKWTLSESSPGGRSYVRIESASRKGPVYISWLVLGIPPDAKGQGVQVEYGKLGSLYLMPSNLIPTYDGHDETTRKQINDARAKCGLEPLGMPTAAPEEARKSKGNPYDTSLVDRYVAKDKDPSP